MHCASQTTIGATPSLTTPTAPGKSFHESGVSTATMRADTRQWRLTDGNVNSERYIGGIAPSLSFSRTARAPRVGIRRQLVRDPGGGLRPLLRNTDVPGCADIRRVRLDRPQRRRPYPLRPLPVH